MKYVKRTVLLFCVVGVIFFVGRVANAASPEDVPRISVDELKDLLDGPEAAPVVLDVRTGTSWEESDVMILSAIREEPGEVNSWAEKYAKEDMIVLYCT